MRATARKFCDSLQALWEDVKPEFRGRKDGDCAEALFTLKSEVITADALKMYGYNPRTSPEIDLPDFVDDSDDNLPSREQTWAASNPAPHVQAYVRLPKRKPESSDGPQQHPAKRVGTEERVADTDHNIRPSQMSRPSQELASAHFMRAKEGLQSSNEVTSTCGPWQSNLAATSEDLCRRRRLRIPLRECRAAGPALNQRKAATVSDLAVDVLHYNRSLRPQSNFNSG